MRVRLMHNYTLSEKLRENILKQIENVKFKENLISDDEEIPEEGHFSTSQRIFCSCQK
jgi:hypothetical protein